MTNVIWRDLVLNTTRSTLEVDGPPQKNELKKTLEVVLLENTDLMWYHYENITYKYVLVPLWLCTYKYNNKEYGFMVNGENGKITGKYPISIPKVLLTIAIFIIIIVVALIIYGLISENNQMYQLLK